MKYLSDRRATKRIASAERVFDVDTPSESSDKHLPEMECNGRMEMKNKCFPMSWLKLIKNFNLNVESERITRWVFGYGKTTVINLLLRFMI